MIITKRGQEWEVIKIYKNFLLCKSKIGYNECFSKFEVFEPIKVHKNEKLFHIDGEPFTTNQIIREYELSRAQVIYRYKTKKPLPDGRIIAD